MSATLLVIFHPGARRLRGDGLARFQSELGRKLGPALEFVRGDARDLDDRIRAVDRARGAILVLGGDGTLNHAIVRIATALGEEGEWPRLGFVPAGTANDAARSLARPRNASRSIDGIAASLAAGSSGVAGDLGRVECPQVGLRRWFVNFCGVGAACDWVRLAESRTFAPVKRLGAWIAYPLCSLAVILKARRTSLQLAIDEGEPEARSLFALFVAKGRYFGGGLDLGDSVRLDSGRLAVVAVPPASRLGLARRLGATRSGRGPAPRPARRVALDLAGPTEINIDGELVPLGAAGTLHLRVDVVPGRARWL